MNKKLFINFLQNLSLMMLSVTAILLLLQFPMLDGVLSGKMRALLSASESSVERSEDLTTAVASVHFAVTDDNEYGRCTKINEPTSGADFQKLLPLIREAIGSAAGETPATEAELKEALNGSGIYVDLTTTLPLSFVAAWLGEEYESADNVCALALIAAQETAVLFFLRDDGTVIRCESALTSSAVRELTASFVPNGGRFAYESDYKSLAPYTILVRETGVMAQIGASIPNGYSAYNLLTALDFNAHTNARYTESGGAEVVIQSPRMLKIGPEGTVRYSSSGEITNELFRIPCSGEQPTSAEILQSACTLADALCSGTNAASLSLESVEKTESGWIISFCYHTNGVRVRLSDERSALRVIVVGDTITEFEYYCRAYTPLQENSALLPPSVAVAIAAMHEGAELTVAYVDNGAAILNANWLSQ